jgi:uncharacterized SAM-binding protein YcdF (DUF218 family)
MGIFLDLTTPPVKSDIIVVLGGGKDTRIKQGFILYKNHYSKSENIIFTGDDLYDEVFPVFSRSQYLIQKGVKPSNIIHIAHVSNTMEELIEIKKYLLKHHLKTVLFVTHPTHTRRIKILANFIADYDDANITISFSEADDTKVWNKNLYFLNFESIKLVLLEYLKIFYNLLKYTVFL